MDLKAWIKAKIGYICGALFLFAILLFGIYSLLQDNGGKYVKYRGSEPAPQMVVMGDSIFAYYLGDDSLAKAVSNLLGITVGDMSFGGTSASYLDAAGRVAYTGDAFCLSALSQAIVTGDFRLQEQADIRLNGTDYYKERLYQLEQIDFSDVQMLLIEHGLNDYQEGVPLFLEGNASQEYSYVGALRVSVERLRKQYPALSIVLVSPPFVWYEDGNGQTRDNGNGNLEAYVEAQKALAGELGLGYIDLYHKVYEDVITDDFQTYTVDGVHPNMHGKDLLAQTIADALKDELK